jgi:hypothetical protein
MKKAWSGLMSDTFLILEQPCDEAITWVIDQVNGAGLQVLRTFDLQMARLAHSECPCPHHGTDQCDCQMVVLLVYADHYQPISLLAHSHDGKTWFSLVNTPQQRADPHLEAAIRQALIPQSIPSLTQVRWSHAS